MLLSGLESLDGVQQEEIVLLGVDLEHEALPPAVRALLARFPRARRISLEAGRSIWAEAPKLAAISCAVLVLVQDYRRLKALALLARATRRFVLVQGRLHPLEKSEAIVSLVPRVNREIERARARFDWPHVPPPAGMGNDYSPLELGLGSLPAGWPRLSVSVMVPVYNRREVLAKTLAGLLHQRYPRSLFEVIIADDGSSDDPTSLIGDFPELSVRVVRQEDLGYRLAEVRNLAILASEADVIVSLDCDMIPVPGFLESHLRWFHGHQSPVCTIGYRRFVDTGSLSAEQIRDEFDVVTRLPEIPAPSAIRDPEVSTRDWRLRIFESSRMLKDNAAPYLLASGGNVAFRRADALAAGLYHTGFRRWGGEDAEFAYRLERRGAYLIPEPGGLAYHQDHPAAVVREEDRKTTQVILGRRVPRLRSYVSNARADFELPRVSVVLELTASHADHVADTLRDLEAQIDRDFELLVFGEGTGALELPPFGRRIEGAGETVGERWRNAVAECHGEYVLPLRAGDRIGPWLLHRLAARLERDTRMALAFWPPVVKGPRSRYSVARHLSGAIVPWPMMFRHRDYMRAGGYDRTLFEVAHFDLGLRLAEQGLVGAVKDVSARPVGHAFPRRDEFREVIQRAIHRRSLGWRFEGDRLRSDHWNEDWMLWLRLRPGGTSSEAP